jgi:DNA polymerase I
VYREIEMPLVPVLSDMERTGVKVDAGLLRVQSAELLKRMEEVAEQAYCEAGGEFNLGSPKQIQEILYERLGLPVLRRTPKGQPSTAEDVLEQMAAEYPLPRLILEHRGLSKLRSTYTERLPERVDPDSGRVHTSYHQAVAATGRLSSSDPNLQNIPVRSEEGRRIRQAFIAEEGFVLLAADYSQIELRIMAHLSRDRGLLDAFAAGQDIHRATAAEVFGVATPEAVSGEQRRAAKAINFGLIYGMSAFGLARNLGIDQGRAREYIERYFARYPGVHEYMESARRQARDQGYVETLFGRRLYLPEIGSRNAARRAQAERVAINAPMQGTAADIIKHAMLKVAARLARDRLPARMIMQVHDELVLEVRGDAVDELRAAVTDDMGSAAKLAVELVVDIGTGANWDAAH